MKVENPPFQVRFKISGIVLAFKSLQISIKLRGMRMITLEPLEPLYRASPPSTRTRGLDKGFTFICFNVDWKDINLHEMRECLLFIVLLFIHTSAIQKKQLYLLTTFFPDFPNFHTSIISFSISICSVLGK